MTHLGRAAVLPLGFHAIHVLYAVTLRRMLPSVLTALILFSSSIAASTALRSGLVEPPVIDEQDIRFIPFSVNGESTVLGDRMQLYQVVLNLIVNGLDAVAERPPEDRWVLVRTAEADGAGVEIEVEDSGKGIAEAIRPTSLNRFLAPSRKIWGWGSRSAIQSCKPTAGGFGLRTAPEVARSFVACYRCHNRPQRHRRNDPSWQ